MRKMTLIEIATTDTGTLSSELNAGRISILKSLDCDKLRTEMKIPGLLSRIIVNSIVAIAGNNSGSLRNRRKIQHTITRFLNWCTPKHDYRVFPEYNHGIVLGFNHPSLGEVLRLICCCVENYPGRKYLFPVNLPWYEALVPVIDKLEMAGLKIMPLITPSTAAKIEKINPGAADAVKHVKNGFEAAYMAEVVQTIKDGDIVVVAPSATRQNTIFKNKLQYKGCLQITPQTMSLIGQKLSRIEEDFIMVPVLCIPPEHADRGLNLFKDYRIAPCEYFSKTEVAYQCKHKMSNHEDASICTRNRQLEVAFLVDLAASAIQLNCADLVCPEYAEHYTRMEPSADAGIIPYMNKKARKRAARRKKRRISRESSRHLRGCQNQFHK